MTNAYTSALKGGQVSDQDFKLRACLSDNGVCGDPNDVNLTLQVISEHIQKQYAGIDPGNSETIQVRGKQFLSVLNSFPSNSQAQSD